jgi:quercetin dioxygenase-like cupin family protein
MMNDQSQKPAVVKSTDGRKIMVLGMEFAVKLSASETGGAYYVFEGVTAPGDGVPPHVHSLEDEIVEVLDGELEIFLDGKAFKATSDAIAFFPRNIVHGFSNPGKIPAKVRFVVSPGANFEKFFEELSALPPTQPPDMTKVMEIFDRYGLPIVNEPAA